MANKASRFPVLCAFVLMAILGGPVFGQAAHSLAALDEMAARDMFNDSRAYVTGFVGGSSERTFRASAVILDQWNVLISGHQAFRISSGFTTGFQVGTGGNYLNSPGSIFDVENVIIHPGWGGGDAIADNDIAILHLATPILGAPSLNIAPVSLGEQLFGVGYGRPGLGSGGYLDDDGQARTFNMYVDRFGSAGGTISTDYIQNAFVPLSFRNDPLAGGGTPGSSGGGVFNASGDLVGLMAGVSGSPPGYFYSTYSLRLDLYNEDFILPNMKVIPAPGAIALLGLGGIATSLRRRRRA